MKREDELVAGGDRLFEELRERDGGWLISSVPPARMLEDEVEGAQRQRR